MNEFAVCGEAGCRLQRPTCVRNLPSLLLSSCRWRSANNANFLRIPNGSAAAALVWAPLGDINVYRSATTSQATGPINITAPLFTSSEGQIAMAGPSFRRYIAVLKRSSLRFGLCGAGAPLLHHEHTKKGARSHFYADYCVFASQRSRSPIIKEPPPLARERAKCARTDNKKATNCLSLVNLFGFGWGGTATPLVAIRPRVRDLVEILASGGRLYFYKKISHTPVSGHKNFWGSQTFGNF